MKTWSLAVEQMEADAQNVHRRASPADKWIL